METIKFRVIKQSDDICRIEAMDCRNIYRKIADGSCICSLDVMYADIERITKEVKKLGNKAVFVVMD